jgi:phage terminase Nu1 subunit (DNA packaging protein)
MELLKQAGFATLHGVSRKTVTKWKERGWLVFRGDLVDVEASNALLKKYRTDILESVTHGTEGNKSGNKQGNKPTAAAGNKSAAFPSPEQRDDESPEDAADRYIEAHGAPWDREEARRIKENYLALLNQLEYEEKSGKLVDLAVAESVLFEQARAARDAWMNWPSRVGPLLAADFGLEADRVTESLTAYVHKQVADLGESNADFRTES